MRFTYIIWTYTLNILKKNFLKWMSYKWQKKVNIRKKKFQIEYLYLLEEYVRVEGLLEQEVEPSTYFLLLLI